MSSATADRLTLRHSRELAAAAELVRRRVQAAAGGANAADIDAWWEEEAARFEALVARGFATGARFGRRYLRRHAAVEGHTVEPVQVAVDTEQLATALYVTGPVAFKTHMRATGAVADSLDTMRETLAGSAERFTMMGGRDTIVRTFVGSDVIAGWRRRLNSAEPCAFCEMLASRGAVYRPGGGVSPTGSGITFAAHDNCHCTAEPLYEREPEPARVQELSREWDEYTEGLSGAAAFAAFRRGRARARSG